MRLARSLVDDVEFSPEDATRSDRDFLVEMVRIAIEAGATTINMPDTVGYTTPEEYGQMFREVRERIPAIDAEGIILSSHCHDDLGLAVGEFAGRHHQPARGRWSAPSTASANAPAMRRSKRLPPPSMCAATATASRPASSLTSSIPTSQVLGQIITFKPSPNKAIVGANAFAHESGIHQHGMLANPLCYEIMTPALVGVSKTHLVLGKHSGRAALRHRLEQLGFTLIARGTAAHLLPLCGAGRPQEEHLRPGPDWDFCLTRFATGGRSRWRSWIEPQSGTRARHDYQSCTITIVN